MDWSGLVLVCPNRFCMEERQLSGFILGVDFQMGVMGWGEREKVRECKFSGISSFKGMNAILRASSS